MASFSDNSLSLSIYEPLWHSQELIRNYGQQVSSYQQTMAIFGGYQDAKFTLQEPIDRLEDWFENGLGRRVVVMAGRNIVWEGLVNRFDVKVGGVQRSFGPYLDIANRIKLIYTSVNYALGAIISGVRTVSSYATDAASIAKYGILTKLMVTSGVQTPAIPGVLVQCLKRYSQPQKAENLVVPFQAKEFSIAVECVGYHALFAKFPYTDLNRSIIDLSAKIGLIAGAEPNGVFSPKFSRIAVNSFSVSRHENSDDLASHVLKNIITLGDSSNRRYAFGVYENRELVYQPVIDEIQYLRPYREKTIRDTTGAVLQPWLIKPGNWLWIPDLLPSKHRTPVLGNDARSVLIETITYTSPDLVIVNGSHLFRIGQQLNQLGLGGIV